MRMSRTSRTSSGALSMNKHLPVLRLLALGAVLVFRAQVCAESPTKILIVNPSLDVPGKPVAGWQAIGSAPVERDERVFHSAPAALCIDRSVAKEELTVVQQVFSVPGGIELNVRAWVKTSEEAKARVL